MLFIIAKIEYGSVSSWIASLLTGSSLLIAAFTYRRNSLSSKREQAGQVAAWIESRQLGTLEPERGKQETWGNQTYEYEATMKIRNGSNLPVYAVRARVRFAGARQISTSFGAANRVQRGDDTPGWVFCSVLPPRNTAVYTYRAVAREEYETSPRLLFRDAAGSEWERTDEGVLALTSPSRPRQIPSRKVYSAGVNSRSPDAAAGRGEKIIAKRPEAFHPNE